MNYQLDLWGYIGALGFESNHLATFIQRPTSQLKREGVLHALARDLSISASRWAD